MTIPSLYQSLPGFKTVYDETVLAQAIANTEVMRLLGVGGNGLPITSAKTIPLVTDGTTGDKTIVPSTSNSKTIYILNLFFTTTSSTQIIFKSGSIALSGAMQISQMSSGLTFPIITNQGQNFVMSLGTASTLNGFVTYIET